MLVGGGEGVGGCLWAVEGEDVDEGGDRGDHTCRLMHLREVMRPNWFLFFSNRSSCGVYVNSR